MTENKRQESMEKIKQGVGPEPLPKKRKYKKKEKIVNAFIIPHYKTLIFQTDDGGLLQPCDVGLVRSSWDKIGDDWIIKKDMVLSTTLCKFDKMATMDAPSLLELKPTTTPFYMI